MAPPAAEKLIPPVRAKLSKLGFDAPLTATSAPLISDLLDALLDERKRSAKLAEVADSQSSALFTAEQVGPALRNEIARLTRENNQLHAAMIELREAADRRAREEDVGTTVAQNQVRDLTFISTSLRKANEDLERENAGLREAASRSYEINGLVLPSGHEVRWHGRKERMISHSPVAPFGRTKPVATETAETAVEEGATAPKAAPVAEEHLLPARLVHAAEAQLTALLKRVEASEAKQVELATEVERAKEQARAREGEAARLGDHLAAALEAGPPAEARRVEQHGHMSRMKQAAHQIDTLNAELVRLQGVVAREQGTSRAARLDDDERQRYLGAIQQLRREKLLLTQELERTAGLAESLSLAGLARPAAHAPLVN